MILTHLVLFAFFPGAGGTVVTPTTVAPTETLGHGEYRGKKRTDAELKQLKAQEIRRLLEVLGEYPETAAKAAQIKAEFSKPKEVKRQGKPILVPVLDVREVARDLDVIRWLIEANEALQERLAREQEIDLEARLFLELEDEAAFLLLM